MATRSFLSLTPGASVSAGPDQTNPENVHSYHVPRCCWNVDHTLRTTGPRPRAQLVSTEKNAQPENLVKFSVQFSRSVMSDSLRSHGLQHARPPCPSPIPRACSNSCPLSQWCHPMISSSLCHPLLLLPSIFPSIRVFSNESVLHIRWPNYWSFSLSLSPSNEYSGLISFRIDCFDFLQSKGISRVFSNTTVQKHQFFGSPLSL